MKIVVVKLLFQEAFVEDPVSSRSPSKTANPNLRGRLSKTPVPLKNFRCLSKSRPEHVREFEPRTPSPSHFLFLCRPRSRIPPTVSQSLQTTTETQHTHIHTHSLGQLLPYLVTAWGPPWNRPQLVPNLLGNKALITPSPSPPPTAWTVGGRSPAGRQERRSFTPSTPTNRSTKSMVTSHAQKKHTKSTLLSDIIHVTTDILFLSPRHFR